MPGESQRPLTSGSGGPVEVRLQAVEERLTLLAGQMEQMEQRLTALALPSLPQAWPLPGPELPGPSSRSEAARWVTFLGRSFLVLGGAFLIRALTDGRVLPGGAGVALGILFAASWVFFAHRAAARGRTLSAGFHGVVAALIAYPLILESSTRLGVMSTPAAALTLLVFTGLLLGASWRDQLGWLAWIGVLSCLLTTVGLLVATPGRGELTGVLLVLTAATFFWPGEQPRWAGLRWAPALVLDLVVLRGALTASPPGLLFPLALAALSLALVLSRTAARRPVGVFEALQTLAGLIVGVVGALRVAREAGAGAGAVAGGVLAVALLAMAFAGWVVPRRGDRDRDFLFYAALSVALLSLGVALVTTGDLRGGLWSLLALGVVILGRRRHPGTLWSLAALLAVGAASSSGLTAGIWQTLTGREAVHWQPLGPGSIAVLGLTLLAYLGTVPPLRPPLSAPEDWASLRVPPAVLLVLACAGLAALVLQTAHSLTADLARLASARTVAAVVLATVLALVRRQVARPELTWIASVVLALGGIELLLVELPNGRPLTLLVSFVLYGAGLIVVPRLAPPGRDLLSSSQSR